jgi:hypothetical protein
MIRPQELARDIVVIDGMSCAGKSFVAPLLSSLDRGELWTINHLYEYLCTMYHYGRMSLDAASTLVQLYADLDLYNLRVGRNTNFRRSDISSAHFNLQGTRYHARTRLKDGDGIVREIFRARPILFLMTHYIFGQSDLLFKAFGSRLKSYLIVVRHPLDLLESWYKGNWDCRVGSDPREFQLCCAVKGQKAPWFATPWLRQYRRLNRLEKSVATVVWFQKEFKRQWKRLSPEERRKVIFLPFEKVAPDPVTALRGIAKKLGAKITPLTGRVMKKFCMPRNLDPEHISLQYRKFSNAFKLRGVRRGIADEFWKTCEHYEITHIQESR